MDRQLAAHDANGRGRRQHRGEGVGAAKPIAIHRESTSVERHVPIPSVEGTLDIRQEIPNSDGMALLSFQLIGQGLVKRPYRSGELGRA
jgi:hypothetical protein